MLVCVMADIHANLPALEAMLDEIKNEKINFYLHCGDLVGYNAFPNECCERVKKLKNFCSVRGNHDEAVLTGDTQWFNRLAAEAAHWTRKHITESNKNYLSSLPLKLEKNIGGRRLLLVHGSPMKPLREYVEFSSSDEYLKLLTGGYDILLLGHTHIPMLRTFDKKMVINPGAIGQPRDGNPEASAMLLSIEEGKEIEGDHIRVKYDIGKVTGENMKAGLPKELSDRLWKGW